MCSSDEALCKSNQHKNSIPIPSSLKRFSRYGFFQKQGVQSFITLGQGCLKIPSLVPKIVAVNVLTLAYTRRRENQADMQVITREKDPEVLRATSDFFKASHDVSKAEFKQENPGWSSFLDRFPSLYDVIIFPTHPRPQKRAEYFLKAAQDLEKKQLENK